MTYHYLIVVLGMRVARILEWTTYLRKSFTPPPSFKKGMASRRAVALQGKKEYLCLTTWM